jgi:hypothetical protein
LTLNRAALAMASLANASGYVGYADYARLASGGR